MERRNTKRPLHWRHNDHDGVLNHQHHGCLLKCYSDADQRKHQSSASLAFCGEFTGTGEFPAQRASYAENVSIWWRHHDTWVNKMGKSTVKLRDNSNVIRICHLRTRLTNVMGSGRFSAPLTQMDSGPCFNINTVFPEMGIPVIKIRRS